MPRIYDEMSTPAEMTADCQALGARMPHLARAARKVMTPATSIHFEDYPREVPKREITSDAAAVRLANALELHLD